MIQVLFSEIRVSALGDTASAATLRARSHGWRMLFDPAVGFLRARNADGSFPSGSFDFLSMGYALRHVSDLHTAFREYRRVLRPGGRGGVSRVRPPGVRRRQSTRASRSPYIQP